MSTNRSQLVSRMTDIQARMEQIGAKHRTSAAEDAEFDQLGAEFDDIDRQVRLGDIAGGAGRFRTVRGSADAEYDADTLRDPRDSQARYRGRDPWDLRDVQTFGRHVDELGREYKARALAAIEAMPCASDNVRRAATSILERHDSTDSRLARFALATSSPEYLRAWSKLARNEQHSITAEESRAINDVQQFRAMSLTDSAGGFLVPFQLDPTVIITSSGVRSDIRQVARQVVATGDVWNGVSSANVSWSFDAEGSEVSDDSPSFGQPSIPNYMARGFIPISIEASMDESNVAQTVGDLLAAGKDELEATKLTVGSGSGEPTGIITALAAASPSVSINTAASSTFALADVYSLQGAVPARFRAKASWLSNNLIYSKIRQFDTSGGGGFWTNLNGDRPPMLMQRDAVESEAMASTVTTGNKLAVFGDFSNFVITDRLGMAVEFIPNLFGANRRPTGQRGWFAYYRVGSDSVNDNAFRMLTVQ